MTSKSPSIILLEDKTQMSNICLAICKVLLTGFLFPSLSLFLLIDGWFLQNSSQSVCSHSFPVSSHNKDFLTSAFGTSEPPQCWLLVLVQNKDESFFSTTYLERHPFASAHERSASNLWKPLSSSLSLEAPFRLCLFVFEFLLNVDLYLCGLLFVSSLRFGNLYFSSLFREHTIVKVNVYNKDTE